MVDGDCIGPPKKGFRVYVGFRGSGLGGVGVKGFEEQTPQSCETVRPAVASTIQSPFKGTICMLCLEGLRFRVSTSRLSLS